MNLQQFANLFNISGIGLVLLISLLVSRKYPSAFFRQWTRAYAWTAIFVALDVVVTHFNRAAVAEFGQTICVSLSCWYFVQTGRELDGKPLPWRIFVTSLAALLLAQGSAMALKAPEMVVVGLPALSVPAGLCWLGWCLVRRETTMFKRTVPWVGWPMIGLGLWVLTYPFLSSTPLFWLGYWISGLFQLLVGIGMVVFLLEETAEELREKNLKLEQLHAIKTNFLSTVSHELRTPLASIQGYMELIDDGLAGPVTTEQHDFFGHMRRASGQLRSLIDTLLDSVQLDAGELAIAREPVNLKQIILKDLEVVRPLANTKTIQLAVLLPDRLPEAMGDEQRITQILNNLLSNAIKFTPEGGKIGVELAQDGNFLAVRVSDNGIGIPSDKLEEVFEPFVQVDGSLTRRYGGSGLGLSITRRLVEAMGGTISLTSQLDHGTTVTFTLPVAAAAQLSPQTAH
ncbi:MAG TPA: HAMP domain-containing sensor histidine kinase [Oscillatoriaceae cyanobacterium]